ncbi:MAG: RDD family protein [Thermoplasmata archaeon]|nr:RDD family protein [Thermoplasmata archaeon]
MTTGFDIIGNNKALQDHWLRRIVALIIDGIIIGVIAFLVSIVFWILSPIGFIGWFFSGLLMFLYFIAFEMMMGGTPGKKLLSLEVVSTQEGELSFVSSLMRNISKIFWVFLLIDWIVGMFTDGDPRQKMLDRYANTTVQRTDQRAYMEQQFRQMAYVPPHPTYQPPPGQPQQQSYQPSQQTQQQPQGQAGAWPHQEEKPKTDWPQHDPGQAPPQQQPQAQQQPQQQSYQPPPQQQASQPPQQDAPRFCQNCGTTLTPGADGRPTCGNCGKTY